MPVCPIHKYEMMPKPTRYGIRYNCVPGCTVVCWDGSTSTPADAETRQLRHECHKLFDPLWRDEFGPFQNDRYTLCRNSRRDRAYSWLAKVMRVKFKDAHFGMFDANQCRLAKSAIQGLTGEHNRTVF